MANTISAEWAETCSFDAFLPLFWVALESALKLAGNCKANKNELKGDKK